MLKKAKRNKHAMGLIYQYFNNGKFVNVFVGQKIPAGFTNVLLTLIFFQFPSSQRDENGKMMAKRVLHKCVISSAVSACRLLEMDTGTQVD